MNSGTMIISIKALEEIAPADALRNEKGECVWCKEEKAHDKFCPWLIVRGYLGYQ